MLLTHKMAQFKESCMALARAIDEVNAIFAQYNQIIDKMPFKFSLQTTVRQIREHASLPLDSRAFIYGLTARGFIFTEMSKELADLRRANCMHHAYIQFGDVYAAIDTETSFINTNYSELGPINEIVMQFGRARYFLYVQKDFSYECLMKHFESIDPMEICRQLGCTSGFTFIYAGNSPAYADYYEVHLEFNQTWGVSGMDIFGVDFRIKTILPKEIHGKIISPTPKLDKKSGLIYYEHPLSGNNFVTCGIKVAK